MNPPRQSSSSDFSSCARSSLAADIRESTGSATLCGLMRTRLLVRSCRRECSCGLSLGSSWSVGSCSSAR